MWIGFLLSLAVAYMFYVSGAEFLAFLTFIIGALLALTSKPVHSAPAPTGEAAPMPGAAPIIIQSAPSQPPQDYFSVEFSPDWGGQESGHEKIGKRFAKVHNYFVGMSRSLFGWPPNR